MNVETKELKSVKYITNEIVDMITSKIRLRNFMQIKLRVNFKLNSAHEFENNQKYVPEFEVGS